MIPGVLAAREARARRLREARAALTLHLQDHAAGRPDGRGPAGIGACCHDLRTAIREAVEALRPLGDFG